MLAESGGDIREGVDPKLLTREHEISNLLNAKGARLLPLMGRDTPQATTLKQEIRALESEYQDVQSAIRKSSPRYAGPKALKLSSEQVAKWEKEWGTGKVESFELSGGAGKTWTRAEQQAAANATRLLTQGTRLRRRCTGSR